MIQAEVMTDHRPQCRGLTQQAAKSLLPAYVIPEWKQKELDDDCAFTANACPTCKGKCCRDSDYRNRVYHMGAECYEHWCDDCHDGQVPAPDPRDALIAQLREEIEGHRKAQAAVYLALGTDESDRAKWPEMIEAMRAEVEKLREAVRVLPKYTAQSFDLNCANTRTANAILAAARKLAGLED